MKFFQLASIASAVNAAYEDLPSNMQYNVEFDYDVAQLRFDIRIPENTYFAVAFGTGMRDTDMVAFFGEGDGTVEDLWSKRIGTPDYDIQNDYTFDVVREGTDYVFTAYRPLQTTDTNGEDYQFTTCESLDMAWVAHTETSELKHHDINNIFTLDLPADCFDSVAPEDILYAPGEFDSAKTLALSAVSSMALAYLTM